MKKLIAFCSVLLMVLALSGMAQATMITYSIVDYPAFQIDTKTGLTDHVSGTITADPDTDVIYSASFTITGSDGTPYTVANALIDNPYYVHITPTEIYLTSTDNPSNPYEYGYLGFRNRTDGGYPNEGVYWYLLGADDNLSWPTLHYSAYNGWYKTSKAGPVNFGVPLGASPWVVATAPAVPEPATLLLMGFGSGIMGAGIRRLKKKLKKS